MPPAVFEASETIQTRTLMTRTPAMSFQVKVSLVNSRMTS